MALYYTNDAPGVFVRSIVVVIATDIKSARELILEALNKEGLIKKFTGIDFTVKKLPEDSGTRIAHVLWNGDY